MFQDLENSGVGEILRARRLRCVSPLPLPDHFANLCILFWNIGTLEQNVTFTSKIKHLLCSNVKEILEQSWNKTAPEIKNKSHGMMRAPN